MNSPTDRSPLPRQTILIVVSLISLVVLCGVRLVSTAQSPVEGRELEDSTPAHLPIKVKLKNAEKVKDLSNENWLADLEIEATNTGSKPIYFLYIVLKLPEVKHDDGIMMAYQLRYGRAELVDILAPVQSDDVPIQPGESTILKVPVNSIAGWKLFKAKRNIPNPKKLKLVFQLINFGDGTGFMRTDGIPLPRSKKQSLNTPCQEGKEKGYAVSSDASAPPDSSHKLFPKLSLFLEPISLKC